MSGEGEKSDQVAARTKHTVLVYTRITETANTAPHGFQMWSLHRTSQVLEVSAIIFWQCTSIACYALLHMQGGE